ncbi:zinc ABC transporter substrate-binding protein [Microbulbifer sp. CAU 1566]|uniref:metal ABC transporter solute-binding protein, Zn/Mn family n=1 Tax=Microbulbifer sp. CAU 1566 TaxID=2933269 RepID=UPI002005BFDD|nr:zinc ABC transporter substrate-binding protein [Microbulbifer sp. CAU 1566]MCK7598125.1 zinc ABC transporter substrate-binding protein [Microbulbifer sp. CAU 1566]
MSIFRTLARGLIAVVAALVLTACDRGENATATNDDGARDIVVSIAPLAMIAAEIAGTDTPVHTLVRNGDPHHYAPKVTDRATMEKAQLVIWMGPAMESVLARQMALLPEQKQLGLLAAGGYEYEGADAGDPHLWLRPRNAAVMAAHIAGRLAELHPQQAEQYRQRARDFSRAMANLQKVQDRALWAYRDAAVVSTHQAYSQFFGPAGVAVQSLGSSASHQHGARTMLETRKPTENGEQRGCLFGEVPANDRDRQTAAHLNLGYQALDPLGSLLPAGAGYRQLMEQLLTDTRQCLGSIPDRSQ